MNNSILVNYGVVGCTRIIRQILIGINLLVRSPAKKNSTAQKKMVQIIITFVKKQINRHFLGRIKVCPINKCCLNQKYVRPTIKHEYTNRSYCSLFRYALHPSRHKLQQDNDFKPPSKLIKTWFLENEIKLGYKKTISYNLTRKIQIPLTIANFIS